MKKVELKIKGMRLNHPAKPSQRELGDYLGIAENNYRNLENNKSKTISFEAITKLCEFFKCEPGELFKVVENT